MSGDDGRSPDSDGTDAASDANGGGNADADRAENPDTDRAENPDADRAENPDADRAENADENGAGNSTAGADANGSTGANAGETSGSDANADPAADGTADAAKPTPTPGTAAARRDGGQNDRLQEAASGAWVVVREMLISVAVVAAVGLLLFAVSGVWPPMVAVKSGSMEPHMYRGDLVVISEPGRYVPDASHGETGVVTLDRGEEVGYRTFGDYGSVVVYRPDGSTAESPVIHRAHFFVEEGENWYDEANPAYHDAGSCSDLPNCPAPNAGFITKGDHNGGYDQALGISDPVDPGWIVGVAHVRIPYLGHVRLWLSGIVSPGVDAVEGDGSTSGTNAIPVAEPNASSVATAGAERRSVRAGGTTPVAGRWSSGAVA